MRSAMACAGMSLPCALSASKTLEISRAVFCQSALAEESIIESRSSFVLVMGCVLFVKDKEEEKRNKSHS